MDDYIIDGDLAFSNSRDALKFYQEQYHKKKEWVGLTKDEVNNWELPEFPTVYEFAKFVAAKLKDKNI